MKTFKIILNMLLNTIPAFLWLEYYYTTIPETKCMIDEKTDNIYCCVILIISIYNLCTNKTIQGILYSILLCMVMAQATFYAGQTYLELGYPMSDEYGILESVAKDHLFLGMGLAIFVCFAVIFIKFILKRIAKMHKSKNGNVKM